MNKQRLFSLSIFLFLGASVFALSVSISGQTVSPCGALVGELTAHASGGSPPYAYQWNTGATTATIGDLPPGSYTVTVLDAMGTEAMATAEVTFLAEYPIINPVVQLSYCGAGSPYAVFPRYLDQVPGDLAPIEPMTFSGVNVSGQWISANDDFWIIEMTGGWGNFVIDYTDANGCPGSFTWQVNPPVAELPTITISNIGGSCSDGSIGSARVSVPSTADENDLSLTVHDAAGVVVHSTPCMGENPGGYTGETVDLSDLAPGDYWAVLDVDEYCLFDVLPSFLAPCADSVMFTIPDLGISCGAVIGTLYVDDDGDCTLDPGEYHVPNTVIAITPGSAYTNTNDLGWFGAEALPGATTFSAQHGVLDQSCSGVVNVVAGTTQTLEVGLAPNTALDAYVSMAATPMRPGMSAVYHLQARNLSYAATGEVTLTLQLDANLSFQSSTPSPSNVSGNTITWTTPEFTMPSIFGMEHFAVTVSLPPDPGLVGTEIVSALTLATQNSDVDLSNNSTAQITTVTASLDPNDKLVRSVNSGSESIYDLGLDEWIDYTIRFQNTGTDTAFRVVITDTLPAELDPTSLLVGARSHQMSWTISGAGILRFTYADILLPDSTTNETASHGLVSFRIKPREPLPPGTTITNVANIYFDFNEPVRTPDATVVTETSTGVHASTPNELVLHPNPSSGTISITGHALVSVNVVDLSGREVYAVQMHPTEVVRCDLGVLPSGVYAVRVRTSDGTLNTVRLVIH